MPPPSPDPVDGCDGYHREPADGPGTLRRLIARTGWNIEPRVFLEYEADRDILHVDLLPVPSATDRVLHERLCVAFDGADVQALPTGITLVGFARGSECSALALARHLVGGPLWAKAGLLVSASEPSTDIVLPEPERDRLLEVWAEFAEREFGGGPGSGGQQASYDVFLSSTWSDVDAVEPIEWELRAAGLTVFRDTEYIAEFGGMTQAVAQALIQSSVVLCYYSKRYPSRPSCQWELTSTLIGARRGRAVAVNPEPTSDHIVPAELDIVSPLQMVWRVRERVDEVTGLPDEASRAVVTYPSRLGGSADFVGRYRQLWAIHTALQGTSCRPPRPPSVLVLGVSGVGKTSLARQYSMQFGDAFPAGVHWTGPFASGGDLVAQFHYQLGEFAAASLGLCADGLARPQLRSLVAEHFTRADRDALLVVDDVPAGLPADVLDQLLLPSRRVKTLLTSRGDAPDWGATTIQLGGLDRAEGRVLFSRIRRLVHPPEVAAVDKLVERCAGHPMLIDLTARSVAQDADPDDPTTPDGFVGRLSRAPRTLAQLVSPDVVRRSGAARSVLQLASVLAYGLIPVSLIQLAVGRLLSVASGEVNRAVGAALTELADRGLARTGDAPAGGDIDGCVVHPLVSDAVRYEESRKYLAGVARCAAKAVLEVLEQAETGRPTRLDRGLAHVRQHIGVLARREDLPGPLRQRLLRAAAWSDQARGALTPAAEQFDILLQVVSDDSDDLLAAGWVKLAAGRHREAYEHACRAWGLAGTRGDECAGYLARFLAARVLDQQGDYTRADTIFWAEDDLAPNRLSAVERLHVRLGRAIGLRLRGRPEQALPVLEEVRGELSRGQLDDPLADPAPTVALELARVLLVAGDPRSARMLTRDLVVAYQQADLDHHPCCLAALRLHADAVYAIGVERRRARSAPGPAEIERRLGALHAEYRDRFGASNSLTLSVTVQCDRAMAEFGRPDLALAALCATERQVLDHLGEYHLLRHRIRHAIGLAYGRLRQYSSQRDVLHDLFETQQAMLGEEHVDTLETKLDLGIATAMAGDADVGEELVGEVLRKLDDVTWGRADLVARATAAAQALIGRGSVRQHVFEALFDHGQPAALGFHTLSEHHQSRSPRSP